MYKPGRMRFPGITVPLELAAPAHQLPHELAAMQEQTTPEEIANRLVYAGPFGDESQDEPDAAELKSGWR